MFGQENIKSQYYSEVDKRKSTRILCILSAILFLAFSVVDFWAIPSALSAVLLVRGVIVIGLVVTYSLTYTPVFNKYHDYILVGIFMLTSMGLEFMIYLAEPTDHAFNVYFAALILILMTMFSWTYMSMVSSLGLTVTILMVYYYIEAFARPVEAMVGYPALFSNIFFIVTAVVIGLVARIMRDRYLRENFLLQMSLKEQVVEKTKEAESHEHLANHDQLTGLPNSRFAKDRLEKNLKRAKELDMSLVIMYLDLNGFKQVNDVYGHKAGDEVLRIVGKRLKSCVRNGDCLARLGGDEFAVGLLVEKHELGIAQDIREKIIQSIAQPMGFEGNVLQIGTSVGMASYPASGDKVSVLIEIADKRMYDAKQKMKKKISADQARGEEDNEFISEGEHKPIVIFPGS